MSAERASKVIMLAPYRAARTVQKRPAPPYLLWYPHIGFVKPMAQVANIGARLAVRGPERA